ncbi:MAG: YggT family protein [Holosporales bacterium]|nr:YggT family protein [Holosporales bacterium]
MYWVIVICEFVMNLFVHIGALNLNNPLIYTIYGTLFKLIEPALCAIRRVIPMTRLDFSRLILFLSVKFFSSMVDMLMVACMH